MVVSSVERPIVSQAPGRHVLYQSFVVPEEAIGQTIQRSFADLYRYIGEHHLIPAGAPFATYNTARPPWEVDVCAPISGPIEPVGEFLYMELPAGRVVSITHVGPYEEVGGAYDAIDGYIRDNGLKMAGSPREIYLSPPDTPPSQIQTILEWPIE